MGRARIEFASASSMRCSEGEAIARSCIKIGWQIAGGDIGGAWSARCSRALFVDVQSPRSKIRCLRLLGATANINLFWPILAPAAFGRRGSARTNSIEITLSSARMRSAVVRALSCAVLTRLFFMAISRRRHLSTRPPFGKSCLLRRRPCHRLWFSVADPALCTSGKVSLAKSPASMRAVQR